MMTALEVLHTVRDRLEGRNFNFASWRSCTCGHIYAAANGSTTRLVTNTPITDPREGPYTEALKAILRAHDYSDMGRSPARAVSDLTNDIATKAQLKTNASRPDYRAAAVKMFNKTIAMLEAEQQQDRLDVLAQARAVVDETPPPEETPQEGQEEEEEAQEEDPAALVLA